MVMPFRLTMHFMYVNLKVGSMTMSTSSCIFNVLYHSGNGLLQFLGTDDSGLGTHRELVDLGRERPLGSTLTRHAHIVKLGAHEFQGLSSIPWYLYSMMLHRGPCHTNSY